MSNWSCVIVAWSGIDSAVYAPDGHQSQIAAETMLRLNQLTPAFDRFGSGYGPKWVVSHPCPSTEAVGCSCEMVAVAHWNHFWVDELMEVLLSMTWEYPEAVQVMYKDEGVGQYASMSLEQWVSACHEVRKLRRLDQ